MPNCKLPRRTSFGLAVALAGTILCGPGAKAADLDPGYADVPAPIPQQNVAFGSGWYIRGDIGVTDKYGVDVEKTLGVKVQPLLYRSKDLGYDATLGGGYSFTNSFRADLTVDFLQPVERVGSRSFDVAGTRYPYSFYANLNRYAALVNGYYDIGTWSIFTPYVGAGVGLGFGDIKASSFATITDQTYINKFNFAWAAMAGVAIDVYNHTKIDIGYRYLNMGTLGGTKVYDHQARIGVRYMIDN